LETFGALNESFERDRFLDPVEDLRWPGRVYFVVFREAFPTESLEWDRDALLLRSFSSF